MCECRTARYPPPNPLFPPPPSPQGHLCILEGLRTDEDAVKVQEVDHRLGHHERLQLVVREPAGRGSERGWVFQKHLASSPPPCKATAGMEYRKFCEEKGGGFRPACLPLNFGIGVIGGTRTQRAGVSFVCTNPWSATRILQGGSELGQNAEGGRQRLSALSPF